MTDKMDDLLAALADSEGTRAVEYLRRARKAEGEVEALRSNQRCAGLEGDETGSPCNTYKLLEARHAEEVEALRKDAENFHIEYRMKCDQQTKAAHTEVEAMRSLILEADRLAGHDDVWTEWRERCAALAARPGGQG